MGRGPSNHPGVPPRGVHPAPLPPPTPPNAKPGGHMVLYFTGEHPLPPSFTLDWTYGGELNGNVGLSPPFLNPDGSLQE